MQRKNLLNYDQETKKKNTKDLYITSMFVERMEVFLVLVGFFK